MAQLSDDCFAFGGALLPIEAARSLIFERVGVVVGMETEAQLDENLRLFVRFPLAPEDCAVLEGRMPRVPERLLDPAQWPRPDGG